MAKSIITLLAIICCMSVHAKDIEIYLKHSSGMIVGKKADARAGLLTSTNARKLKLRDLGDGYYLIVDTDTDGTETYMTLNGGWNTYFESDATTDNAKYAIEGEWTQMVKLRNKSNNRYLGTDSNDAGSNLYSDKDGNDSKHCWYLADDADAPTPTVETTYLVFPSDLRQKNEGWGVSLCWWANMCGKWSDAKINTLVEWLTSPTGLNFNIFRYNIGGGDDPNNTNCTLHHMGNGKGLRAEMEGFKTKSTDEYDWSKDEAQRKIMLKIKEKRPDAIFEAFSNSAPYYMTYSGCVAGSVDGGSDNLKPEYYEEFAHYLVDVCKHYKDVYDIDFRTLEPFNESVTSFWYANGAQEGCHFDYSSQIKFIKVLSPILKASGLSTVISASDETNVGLALGGLEEYKKGGVLDLVDQWNTHTYQADNVTRNRLGTRSRAEGKTLWMSETGSGGNGIGGNLAMAQRMFDDIKCMMPAAWIDWQYMEELNDQWCMVRGSFSGQTFEKVKNYYVRQQVTRHIKQGYSFVTSQSPQSLAAVNEAGDSLVLVVLNAGATSSIHHINLSGCKINGDITCYQTSATRNHQRTTAGYTVAGNVMTAELPATSITTYIIPIKSNEHKDGFDIVEGEPYIIMPQYNPMALLTAKSKVVNIKDVEVQTDAETVIDASQIWYFEKASNDAYYMVNANGERLTATSGYAMTTQTAKGANQTFRAECVDGVFCKITCTQNNKSFDLSNAAYSSGTQVGLWDYGTNVTEGHRNWYLCPLTAYREAPTSISDMTISTDSAPLRIYDISGAQVKATGRGIYIVKYSDGSVKKMYVK